MVYICLCLDDGVMRPTAETATRSAIEGPVGGCAARRLWCRWPARWASPLAYFSESPFIWRSLGREYVYIHRRVRLAAPPGWEDSVPDKPDFRGDLDPSACSALAPTSRLGRGHPVSLTGQKAHRSVYNISKALYSGALEQSVRCTWPVGRHTWQLPPYAANGWRSSDGASRYQHSPGARPGRRHS
jgi:hypothetical protein